MRSTNGDLEFGKLSFIGNRFSLELQLVAEVGAGNAPGESP